MPGNARRSSRMNLRRLPAHLARGIHQRQRFIALALVCLSLVIAIGERSALSVAAPALSSALAIDARGMGWLLSAFSWSYVIAQVPGGLFVERVGVRAAIGIGIAASSLTSLLVAAAGAPALVGAAWGLILFARVMMGVAQAPIGASSGVVLSTWFPRAERGTAGAVYGAMAPLALAVLNPLMGLLANGFGWRAMFVGVGILSMVVAVLWLTHFRAPAQHGRLSAKERRLLSSGGALWGGPADARRAHSDTGTLLDDLRQLFAQRIFVASVAAQYCIVAITWFFVAWFPTYLVHDLGYSIAEAGAWSALPAVAGVVGGISAGVVSDWLLRRTHSLTRARKWPVYAGMGIAGSAFAACTVLSDPQWIVAMMALAFFGKGFATLVWAVVSDIAPSNRVGLTGSVVNAISNVSGIVTPIVVGYLVALGGNFRLALALMALHAFGAIGLNLLMGPLTRMADLQPRAR